MQSWLQNDITICSSSAVEIVTVVTARSRSSMDSCSNLRRLCCASRAGAIADEEASRNFEQIPTKTLTLFRHCLYINGQPGVVRGFEVTGLGYRFVGFEIYRYFGAVAAEVARVLGAGIRV